MKKLSKNTHSNNTENRNYSCDKNITKFENKRTKNDKYNNNHDNNNKKINNKGFNDRSNDSSDN